ncbi:hypothetical protein KRX51_09525 [Corynebacterium sp. TAE3-ERU12]|uniref:hypothetical protein n=1 Tax=Corynebacterium sp. TAE3-ERU12 TaxID=2849491 RepID=UPI001C465393|nr:hypothetical protein [Corynebacterium sp. TAE3-ERU12]MBV7296148.1 hypothetical protein [Corynebacterium sp. TAE3-ERU12]
MANRLRKLFQHRSAKPRSTGRHAAAKHAPGVLTDAEGRPLVTPKVELPNNVGAYRERVRPQKKIAVGLSLILGVLALALPLVMGAKVWLPAVFVTVGLLVPPLWWLRHQFREVRAQRDPDAPAAILHRHWGIIIPVCAALVVAGGIGIGWFALADDDASGTDSSQSSDSADPKRKTVTRTSTATTTTTTVSTSTPTSPARSSGGRARVPQPAQPGAGSNGPADGNPQPAPNPAPNPAPQPNPQPAPPPAPDGDNPPPLLPPPFPGDDIPWWPFD